MKNTAFEALHRFMSQMCDIEYVKTHKGYKMTWGLILFFKELIIWFLLCLLIGYINSEINAVSLSIRGF